jgi:uncharacterized membrane protein
MKKSKVAIIVLMLLSLVVSGISLAFLDDIIPTHFGVDGNPDQYGSKYFILMFSGIMVIIGTAMLIVANHKRFSDNYKKYLLIIGVLIESILLILLGLFIISGLIYKENNEPLNISKIILPLMGVMFIIMGNYMPKIEKNRTLGFKTKWSLHNEVTWAKTHRFCGFAMVIAGLISMAVSFIFSEEVCFIILMSVLLVTFVSTFVYSYKVYKEEKAKE